MNTSTLIYLLSNQLFRRYITLLLAFICNLGIVYSQKVTFDPVYYNITTEHGLPSLETYSVQKDSKGYIWISTDAGVCRYDGYEYKTYTVADGLTDNVVFDVYEDFNGRIWFLTYNSMLCYLENDKIKPYKYNYKIKSLLKNKIAVAKSLSMDKKGNLYYQLSSCGVFKIYTNGVIEQLCGYKNAYVVSHVNNQICVSYFQSSVDGKKSTLKLLSAAYGRIKAKKKGVYVDFNMMSQGIRRYFAPINEHNLNSNYFAAGDKIFDFKSGNAIFQSNGIISFCIKDSIFWICTSQGLLKCKKQNGKLIEDKRFLKNFFITSIKFEKNGNVWISTLNSGILFVPNIEIQLADINDGLLSSDIISIVRYRNDLITGTWTNIQNISTETKIIYPGRVGKTFKLITIKDRLLISSDYFSAERIPKKGMGKIRIIYDFAKNDSVVYFVLDSYIFEYNVNTNSHKKVYLGFFDQSKNGQFYINNVIINDENELIVSSRKELFRFEHGKLVPLKIPFKQNIDISSLGFHEKWGMVIGTSGNGLLIYKNGKLSDLTVEDGLLSNRVNTLEISEEGHLYVGTPIGMSIFKPTGEVGVFGRNQSLEMADVNVIFLEKDTVFLGTKIGIFKIEKSAIENCFSKTKVQKVILKSIEIDNISQRLNKSISFPYDGNILMLNFSVLQFDNWHSKQYQYRIGKNGQWINIESPSISLYRPSGEFDIEVRYMNANFQWSSPTKLCHVNVLIPFWRQWYFWVAISSVILFLLFKIYQRRQLRIQEKLIQETQMLSLEQQMQNARMNPHFIFNVFNSIHSFMLQQNIEEAEKYLERFSKLLREILSNSSEGTIPLLAEKSILNKYLELEQLRFKHSFEYEVNVPFELQELKIPSMLIQPFVENAVLYSDKSSLSKKSMIKVDVSLKNKRCIEVIVLNSGLISAENLAKIERSSIKNAIGITKKRLDNYNKLYELNDFSLSVKIIDNEFTVIRLNIPIIHEK